MLPSLRGVLKHCNRWSPAAANRGDSTPVPASRPQGQSPALVSAGARQKLRRPTTSEQRRWHPGVQIPGVVA